LATIPTIKTKFPKIGQSIFSEMSALALKEGALNLAQGFPDFNPPQALLTHLTEALPTSVHQYAPMPGLMSLREGIAEKIEKRYSTVYNPETEITVVPGATIGIYAAITAIVKENDEVLVFEPAYDSYVPAIEAAGAKPVFAELKFPDFRPDWEEVKKLLSNKTKLIIINSPHNPSGTAWTAQDFIKLDKLLKNTDIVVISDEVYEHILFDGYEHQSIARFPSLAAKSFLVFSFGKTYHCTGWKMGYVVAPRFLMDEFRKIYQYMAFSCSTPFQVAFEKTLKNEDLYLSLADFYQQKRDLLLKGLAQSRFKFKASVGTYFQLIDYSKISDLHDKEFAYLLTQQHKIALIPISPFYRKKDDIKMLRVCFAKQNDVLEKGLEILCKI
jgi:methionine aminotransferase